jgi:hypothetical protein
VLTRIVRSERLTVPDQVIENIIVSAGALPSSFRAPSVTDPALCCLRVR